MTMVLLPAAALPVTGAQLMAAALLEDADTEGGVRKRMVVGGGETRRG